MKPSDLVPTGRTESREYIRLRILDHPYAGKDGYVYEHRFVMEKALSRFLSPDEVVHHKNEDPTDNRLENLELMTGSDHSSHHHSYKIELLCPTCKKNFYRAPCRTKGRKEIYCSRKCLHESLRGVKKVDAEQLVHGTAVAYRHHGCRCDLCREGQRIRVSQYRQKHNTST